MRNIGIERLFEIQHILHDIIICIHDFEIFEEIEIILITQMFELIHFEIDFIIVEVEFEIEFNYELTDVIIIII
jgi:hypothetical protein